MEKLKNPWFSSSTPRPPHRGHVRGVVPGRAPEPWQVERAFWTGVAAGRNVVWPHLAANAVVLDSQGVVFGKRLKNQGGEIYGGATTFADPRLSLPPPG